LGRLITEENKRSQGSQPGGHKVLDCRGRNAADWSGTIGAIYAGRLGEIRGKMDAAWGDLGEVIQDWIFGLNDT
jgi:hypothetical protein